MTTRVVLDASVALAWLIQSQHTPASIAFATQTAGDELVAPICFRWETRHALLKLERRGLLDASQVISDLTMLESRMNLRLRLRSCGADGALGRNRDFVAR
jgi:predicted nucleic acid-binding protein